MADDKEAEGGEESAVEEYRRRMREAIANAKEGRVWAALEAFLRTSLPPAELDGSRDRTHSFHGTTAIMKTLGPEEGLRAAMEYNPDLDEVATAYLVVFGRTLREDAPEVDARRVRKAVARLCNELCDQLSEVMVYADPGQHHALTTLMGECRWCAREVCGDDAAASNCERAIARNTKEKRK